MKYPDLKLLLDAANTAELIGNVIALVIDKNNKPHPDIKALKAEYNPEGHAIFDKTKRPDRTVYDKAREAPGRIPPGAKPGDPLPEPEVNRKSIRTESVNRIAVPFQRYIVESRVNFAFGLPVKLEADTDGEPQENYIKVLGRVFKKNKIDTVNREHAREGQRATRVAEYWYFVPGESNTEYGIKMTGKLRVATWKPWDGNELYPFYDDFGDMVAFGRGYTVKDAKNEDEQHFELYTAEFKYHWVQSRLNGWVAFEIIENPYGKIPIIYTQFDEPAWSSVRSAISRLETSLSDHGEINSYNATPTWFISGGLADFFEKDDKGRVMVGGPNSKMDVISWDNAPESIKLEIELLFRNIYGFTNTPDMSFEQMAKMTNPSGETMKMLFMAAHLQVLSDSEKYNDWQERRLNLLKSMLSYLAPELKAAADELDIEPRITPFMIDNNTEKINMLATAIGAGIISEKTGTTLSGLVENADKEIDQINEEKAAADERTNANFQIQNTLPE